MPETMRCLEITESGGRPTLTERPIPEYGPTEVLIEVEATAIGQTVVNSINRIDDSLLPHIPGHEAVGQIVETGDGVEHLEPGQRVTAYYHLVCGHCTPCQEGRAPVCENHRGHWGVDTEGGYAEYAVIPVGNAVPVPESVDPIDATAISDAVGTPVHVASQRAAVEPGDRMMVIGAGGGVGIHLLQVAQFFGAEVTAVDIVDDKLDFCSRELGAEFTINAADESLTEAVHEFGVRYDSVVDFVGDTALLEEALDVMAPYGRLVNLTTFPGNTMEVSPRQLVSGEIEVIGSRYNSKFETRKAAELVADGIIEPVISEVVGFDGVADLLDTVESNQLLGRGAMTPT